MEINRKLIIKNLMKFLNKSIKKICSNKNQFQNKKIKKKKLKKMSVMIMNK